VAGAAGPRRWTRAGRALKQVIEDISWEFRFEFREAVGDLVDYAVDDFKHTWHWTLASAAGGGLVVVACAGCCSR
jgi:hypothetical protein